MAIIFLNTDILDYGLDRLKTQAKSIAVIDYNYAAGDSYATVRGVADANIIAELTGVVPGDTVLTAYGTNGRKATLTPASNPIAVKQSSGTTDYLRFAVLDTVNSKVLAVFDSAIDRVIYINDPVLIEVFVLTFVQPVLLV